MNVSSAPTGALPVRSRRVCDWRARLRAAPGPRSRKCIRSEGIQHEASRVGIYAAGASGLRARA
ncbi:MAG: hypothetical protein RL701_6981 [Pseudomonadota bacterium]